MSWSRLSRHARGYGRAWEVLRLQVLRRDCSLCQRCLRAGRATVGKEVHHVVPKARGGTDDMTNLETLCGPCHLRSDAEAQGRSYQPKQTIGTDGFPIDEHDG